MLQPTPEQIKEIAEYLQMGMRVYWNKKTGEIVTIPDESRGFEIEEELWGESLQKIEDEFADLLLFEGMPSREAFEMMVDFTEGLPDKNPIKRRLIYALEHSKPFGRFKNEIENAGDERDQWFTFRDQQWIDWVKDQWQDYRECNKL